VGSIPTLATVLARIPPSVATGRLPWAVDERNVSAPPADDFVDVASVRDVPLGDQIEIEIDDQVLILANEQGKFYAVTAWCTHSGTSLVLGRRSGPVLICWAHLWRFDVRTGKPVWPPLAQITPGYALRTHPVRVEGDRVLVSRIPGPPTPQQTAG
jgi:3-phenylpropionate/trans-cinnamate dioxygenase ferredoxin component